MSDHGVSVQRVTATAEPLMIAISQAPTKALKALHAAAARRRKAAQRKLVGPTEEATLAMGLIETQLAELFYRLVQMRSDDL